MLSVHKMFAVSAAPMVLLGLGFAAHAADHGTAPSKAPVSAVVVSANSWTDSGIAFSSGQTVRVQTAGYVCAGGNGVYCENPNGTNKVQTNGNFPAPGCPAYSLIGRISDSGTPFCLGSRNVQQADDDGDLELAVNTDQPESAYGAWVSLVTQP
jgi:hypothetical protein